MVLDTIGLGNTEIDENQVAREWGRIVSMQFSDGSNMQMDVNRKDSQIAERGGGQHPRCCLVRPVPWHKN